MCSGSYERIQPRSLERFRPSSDVRGALSSTLGMLMESPEHTMPVGRKLFGVQHYMTGGWFYDEENNRVIEFKSHWLERGLVANFVLNPHRSRRTVMTISVAHIEVGDATNGEQGALPYRLYFYRPDANVIDTCQYDDYEADSGAVQGLGDSQIMREQLDLARELGEDALTPQTEDQLVRSLYTGCEVNGWQPLRY